MTNLWKKKKPLRKNIGKIEKKKRRLLLEEKTILEKKPLRFANTKTKHHPKKKEKNTSLQKNWKPISFEKKKPWTEKHTHLFWQKQNFFWNNKQPFWERQPLTMTMTMTHSDKVSIRCQPCPTDSNEEVVPSAKKESVKVVGILHSSQVARSIPVRRQVVTRTLERRIWTPEFSNVHHFKDACHSLQSCSAKNWLWVAPARRKKKKHSLPAWASLIFFVPCVFLVPWMSSVVLGSMTTLIKKKKSLVKNTEKHNSSGKWELSRKNMNKLEKISFKKKPWRSMSEKILVKKHLTKNRKNRKKR